MSVRARPSSTAGSSHRRRPRAARAAFARIVALTAIEQMQELQAALSLNKSQLAGILRVTRPTLYELAARKGTQRSKCRAAGHAAAHPRASICFFGKPAQCAVRRTTRGRSTHRRSSSCSARNRSTKIGSSALSSGPGHSPDSASRRRTAREERLRTLGFEELGGEQRRRQLATNVALREWPERSIETT